MRGQNDLSCHCAGALGDHRISWWLIGRNSVLIVGLLFLFVTPVDTFTVGTLLSSSTSVHATLWINTALPVALLVGMVLIVLVLLNFARTFFRS